MLPEWNNSDEYISLSSFDFENDIQAILDGLENLKSFTQKYSKDLTDPEQIVNESFLIVLRNIIKMQNDIYIIFNNLSSFVHCEQALNAKNNETHKINSKLEVLGANLKISIAPWNLFVLKTTPENFEKIMNSEEIRDYYFYFLDQRKVNHTLLSVTEENLITKLKPSGHLSWGNLYDAISGTAKVEIIKNGTLEKVSIAVAVGLIKSNDEKIRESAWRGLQKAWSEHKESVAQILNSLAGWRLDINELRSIKKEIHFLDQPLHENRISRSTLDAMMNAIQEFKLQIQLGAKTMAKHLGKTKLDPWDLLAPAPVVSETLSFEDSFSRVKNSFFALDSKMGDFAQMMLDKSWIDASVRPNKRNGAFCTGFAKSRNPRIFQTFTGTSHDTSTMAHELGHAYHSWVMRDMNLIASSYP